MLGPGRHSGPHRAGPSAGVERRAFPEPASLTGLGAPTRGERALMPPTLRSVPRWSATSSAGFPSWPWGSRYPFRFQFRLGRPGNGYPWAWHVGPWLPGGPVERHPPDDVADAARVLGSFLAALHRPAPSDAPSNPYRGTPLTDRTERLLSGIDMLGDRIDGARVRQLWAELVDTAPWDGPPLWLHGDVHPLNLLVHDGQLSAVIDFGDVCAGDPASDLAVAWMLLPSGPRPVLRDAAGVDDATWIRAEGWALALGVAMANGDGRVAAIGRRAVDAVLADER